jgi:hypothetical protein
VAIILIAAVHLALAGWNTGWCWPASNSPAGGIYPFTNYSMATYVFTNPDDTEVSGQYMVPTVATGSTRQIRVYEVGGGVRERQEAAFNSLTNIDVWEIAPGYYMTDITVGVWYPSHWTQYYGNALSFKANVYPITTNAVCHTNADAYGKLNGKIVWTGPEPAIPDVQQWVVTNLENDRGIPTNYLGYTPMWGLSGNVKLLVEDPNVQSGFLANAYGYDNMTNWLEDLRWYWRKMELLNESPYMDADLCGVYVGRGISQSSMNAAHAAAEADWTKVLPESDKVYAYHLEWTYDGSSSGTTNIAVEGYQYVYYRMRWQNLHYPSDSNETPPDCDALLTLLKTNGLAEQQNSIVTSDCNTAIFDGCACAYTNFHGHDNEPPEGYDAWDWEVTLNCNFLIATQRCTNFIVTPLITNDHFYSCVIARGSAPVVATNMTTNYACVHEGYYVGENPLNGEAPVKETWMYADALGYKTNFVRFKNEIINSNSWWADVDGMGFQTDIPPQLAAGDGWWLYNWVMVLKYDISGGFFYLIDYGWP